MKYSFSENARLLSISRNSLQIPSLDYIRLGNFTLSNVEDGKIGFEIFLIDCHADYILNKNIAGKYQKILVSVSPMLYYPGQPMQGAISLIPWFI